MKTDDRYRINQDSEAILASFWEVLTQYGNEDRVAADERVAICRDLAATLKVRSGPLRRRDVIGAFERIGLHQPPRGFARDLIARLERIIG